MIKSIIQVSNLSKNFGKRNIIKDISFDIKEGEIVGFVGPNGAGKTTTLRLLTNLIFPDKGTIEIDGYNLLKDREKALQNIAAIIENPGIYKYLSGRDNMEFIRKIRGKSKDAMNSMIKYIGLEDRINEPVKKYSLGMKQRLALGMSLLSEPKLLILDEPTNGLDPTGTIEFRELISSLAKEKNISILFSSHLLSEVDKVCHKVIFIKDGEIISIKDNKLKDNEHQTYLIQVSDIDKTNTVIKNLEYVYNVSCQNNNHILVEIKNNKLNDVLKLLNENNIEFFDIEKLNSNIETEYSKIYKENN